MERLPSEIVLDMLSRLPVESALDCKLVSKSFLILLTTRKQLFAKMHHHRQLLQLADGHEAASSSVKLGILFSFVDLGDEDSVGLFYGDKYNDEINIHENLCYKALKRTNICCNGASRYNGENVLVGSCNGLVCLNRYHFSRRESIFICNPVTGEYVNLPNPDPRPDYTAVFGFGFVVHSVTNYEYKVVMIYYRIIRGIFSPRGHPGRVMVYTIGSGRGWRNKGTTTYQLGRQNLMGVFANGALYWLHDHEDIVAFGLADEEFRLVEPPPCLNPVPSECYSELRNLGGKLCLFQDKYKENRLEIWSLKRNCVEESWTRDFGIAYGSASQFHMTPLLVTKKNQVLMVEDKELTLYCYDPETSSIIQLWDDDSMTNVTSLHAISHMSSFVSLKDLGEESMMKKRDIGQCDQSV